MPPRTDFLTKQRQQIEARLKELQPAHEEYLTLLEARDALAGVKPANGRRGPGRPPGRRGPGRPPGSAAARSRRTARGAQRRRRAPTRRRRDRGHAADQALALIKQNPGITVPDIADTHGHPPELPVPGDAGSEAAARAAATAAFTRK